MRTLLLVLIASAGLVTSGCGSSEDSVQSTVTPQALDGSTFTATGAQGIELDDEVPLTISFEGNSLAVDAGCNSIGGEYEIEQGEIRGTQLVSTLMGCPAPLDEIETETTGLLSDGAMATLEGDTLTLTGEEGKRLTLER